MALSDAKHFPRPYAFTHKSAFPGVGSARVQNPDLNKRKRSRMRRQQRYSSGAFALVYAKCIINERERKHGKRLARIDCYRRQLRRILHKLRLNTFITLVPYTSIRLAFAKA